MDFTVITPNLNYGKFLRECLQSVAGQSGVEWEHLVMDGGSTDDSAEIVAGFPKAKFFQQGDSGMSQAINRGFDRANGEWVMWLNADDRLKPDALKTILPKLRSCEEDVVYGDFDFVNADGVYQRSVKLLRWSLFVHVHHHCYIGSTAAFYRKSTVIDNGFRLREDFAYVMDGEFYARLDAADKRFGYRRGRLADFRIHGDNASMRNLGREPDVDQALVAERQHIESRAIRRVYGYTLFDDPYLNGMVDGFLWIVARVWKGLLKL